eukprot:SAG31_NODE_21627_length_545_cov_0.690583_1_plen_36_part_10
MLALLVIVGASSGLDVALDGTRAAVYIRVFAPIVVV